MSNKLDPGEMPSYSVSHPDPSSYGTLVVSSGLRVKGHRRVNHCSTKKVLEQFYL